MRVYIKILLLLDSEYYVFIIRPSLCVMKFFRRIIVDDQFHYIIRITAMTRVYTACEWDDGGELVYITPRHIHILLLFIIRVHDEQVNDGFFSEGIRNFLDFVRFQRTQRVVGMRCGSARWLVRTHTASYLHNNIMWVRRRCLVV